MCALAVWMEVISQFERAVFYCEHNDERAAVTAWDAGAVMWSGTLTGEYGLGSGKLLFTLANKRCQNFKTCITGTEGNARANEDLAAYFTRGQVRSRYGHLCLREAAPIDTIIYVCSWGRRSFLGAESCGLC